MGHYGRHDASEQRRRVLRRRSAGGAAPPSPASRSPRVLPLGGEGGRGGGAVDGGVGGRKFPMRHFRHSVGGGEGEKWSWNTLSISLCRTVDAQDIFAAKM